MTEEERARAYWQNQRAILVARLDKARRLQAPAANLRALQARWEPLRRVAGLPDLEEPTEPLVGAAGIPGQIVIQGPPGITGGIGPVGPAGPPGAALEWDQVLAATVWPVDHYLGYQPAVQAYDTLNQPIEGLVTHLDADHLTITFVYAIAGKAYLS